MLCCCTFSSAPRATGCSQQAVLRHANGICRIQLALAKPGVWVAYILASLHTCEAVKLSLFPYCFHGFSRLARSVGWPGAAPAAIAANSQICSCVRCRQIASLQLSTERSTAQSLVVRSHVAQSLVVQLCLQDQVRCRGHHPVLSNFRLNELAIAAAVRSVAPGPDCGRH